MIEISILTLVLASILLFLLGWATGILVDEHISSVDVFPTSKRNTPAPNKMPEYKNPPAPPERKSENQLANEAERYLLDLMAAQGYKWDEGQNSFVRI